MEGNSRDYVADLRSNFHLDEEISGVRVYSVVHCLELRTALEIVTCLYAMQRRTAEN